MNILFVTLYPLEANTSVTISNLGLLDGLKKLNYKVTIIMPSLDSNALYYDNNTDLRDYNVIRIPGSSITQKVARINSKNRGKISAILMILRNAYLKMSLFDRSKEYIKKAKKLQIYSNYYDIIISTSDPKTSHLFVKECIKNGLKYGKWIQHWGDPLFGDISQRSIYPSWYIKKTERNIIKHADSIIYVSPFTANFMKKNHPMYAFKINFTPLMCYNQTRKLKNITFQTNSIIKIAFVGDYNSKIRDILPLYESCKQLNKVKLTIAGNTDLSLKSTDTIQIYKRVTQAKAKEIEEEADIIVSVGNRFGTQIPGKIYYLASTEKVILIAMENDKKEQMKQYFDSFERYVTCENNIESIKNCILNIINSPKFKFKTPEKLLSINIVKSIINTI